MKKVILKSIILSILLSFLRCEFVSGQDLPSAIKLTRSEQFYKADLIFRSLISGNPEDGSAYFYFGENYLQKYFSDTLAYTYSEMADSAKSLFLLGISKESENPLNYIGVGEIELNLKNTREANTYFDKALSYIPSVNNKTSKLPKKEQANVLIKIASAFINSQSTDTARVFSLLREAEKKDNKNFDLYIVFGDAYLQMLNNGSKAIVYYNRAQMMNPKSPRAKQRIGQLWVRAKDYPAALDIYREAIAIDSNFAPAYREMGYLYFKTHQAEKANVSFAKFLSLSAGSRSARVQYINTLIELQDYVEALKQIKIVRDQDSSNNDFNRALAYSYYETGGFEKGLYYMTKFLETAPSEKIRTLDLAYYGKLLFKNNMDSLSALTLIKAYDRDTTQTELLNTAINSWLKIKNYNNAIDLVSRKISMNKNVGADYFLLGKIYYEQKDWQKADSAFSLNISLDPKNIKGHLYKAYSLVNMDPDSKLGLAKPAFELLIENAKGDSLNNIQELKQAYSYLSYYYFVQYNKTKIREDGLKSKQYCEKVLEIEPADKNANTILKDLNARLK